MYSLSSLGRNAAIVALMLVPLLVCTPSCKPIKNEPTITAEEPLDSVFNVEENKVTLASKYANKFKVMLMDSAVLKRYTDNTNFASFYFVYENEDAEEPRSTIIVCYALSTTGDWLEKDSANNPIPVPLSVAVKTLPRKFPKGKSATMGQINVSVQAISELKSTLKMPPFKYLKILPTLNSPLSISMELTDSEENPVSGSCAPQPCPPAKPGARGCAL